MCFLCAWLNRRVWKARVAWRSSFSKSLKQTNEWTGWYTWKCWFHSHWRPIYCCDGAAAAVYCTHAILRHIWILIHSSYYVWRRSSTKPNLFSVGSENKSCNRTHLQVTFRIILHITRRHRAPCLFVQQLIPGNFKHGQRFSIGIRTMCDINIKMYRRPRDDQLSSEFTWRRVCLFASDAQIKFEKRASKHNRSQMKNILNIKQSTR